MKSEHASEPRPAQDMATVRLEDLVRQQTTQAPRDPTWPRHSPGEVLAGKYALVSVIREGSTGTIWHARNASLDADVALKLPRRDAWPELSAEVLRASARACARVLHPGVVTVHDIAETEHGEPLVVMELLRGPSLGEWRKGRGPLPPLDAVRMLLPIVGGLCEAHFCGVVHRDVRPSNISVVPEGWGGFSVKLVDFGVPRPSLRTREMPAQSLRDRPHYLAPEQILGLPTIDERVDVWALCAVLHELVDGAPPFSGPDDFSTCASIVDDRAAAVPAFATKERDLWSVVQRGLEKTVGKRFRTMRELGEALSGWVLASGASADVTGSSIAAHWGVPARLQ